MALGSPDAASRKRALPATSSVRDVVADIRYTRAPASGERAGIVVSAAPRGGAAFPLDKYAFRCQHGSVPLAAGVSESDAWVNELVPQRRAIADARDRPFSLDTHGFELAVVGDAGEEERVAYYRRLEALAKERTGASSAWCYCAAYRCAGGAKKTAGYAPYAHSDQSPESWSARLPGLVADGSWESSGPPGVAARAAAACAAGSRYAVLSAWRYLGPSAACAKSHLAVLDHSTVRAGDLLPFSIVADGTFGGNYRLRAGRGAGHAFHYYPAMTRDEVLLFSVFDSDHPARCTTFKDTPNATVLHTAFDDPNGADEPARESIDVRILLAWD